MMVFSQQCECGKLECVHLIAAGKKHIVYVVLLHRLYHSFNGIFEPFILAVITGTIKDCCFCFYDHEVLLVNTVFVFPFVSCSHVKRGTWSHFPQLYIHFLPYSYCVLCLIVLKYLAINALEKKGQVFNKAKFSLHVLGTFRLRKAAKMAKVSDDKVKKRVVLDFWTLAKITIIAFMQVLCVTH